MWGALHSGSKAWAYGGQGLGLPPLAAGAPHAQQTEDGSGEEGVLWCPSWAFLMPSREGGAQVPPVLPQQGHGGQAPGRDTEGRLIGRLGTRHGHSPISLARGTCACLQVTWSSSPLGMEWGAGKAGRHP